MGLRWTGRLRPRVWSCRTVSWSDLGVRNIPLGLECRVGCRLRPATETVIRRQTEQFRLEVMVAQMMALSILSFIHSQSNS